MRTNQFWRRVYAIGERSGDGCWEWDGGRTASGYGAVSIDGRQHKVSRLVLGLPRAIGKQGPWALHRCDNPPCCNPEHLYVGTPTDNNRDTIRRQRRKDTRKTHCKRGHELTTENSWPTYQNGVITGRRCRQCKREHNKQSEQRYGKRWYAAWRKKHPPKAARTKPTHCPQGHAYTPDNVYVYGKRRRCRICQLARAAKYRATH